MGYNGYNRCKMRYLGLVGTFMQLCEDNRFCASIPEGPRSELCARCSKRTFEKDEIIDQNIYEKFMTLILEGAIAYVKSTTGKMQVLNTSCDLLASEYLFNDNHIIYSDIGQIVAFRKTEVAMLPLETLRSAFMNHPSVAKAMYMNLSVIDNRKAFYRLMVQMEDAYHAVLYMMLYLQKRGLAAPTHEELAFLTGLNRVTVTRAVGKILHDRNYANLREYMEEAMHEER